MLKAVTHNGTFHADDVFAYAVLKAATNGQVELTRSRDETVFAAAEVLFDVGGVCDPSKGRYDHHMREKPMRTDGMPFSSVGLVWRDYGRAAVRTLQPAAGEVEVERIWRMIDQGVIRDIDISDNGALPSTPGHVALVLESWNPTHAEPERDETAAFFDAATAAGAILERCTAQAAAAVLAMGLVESAAQAAADPRILVLDRKVPWEEAVFELDLDQLLFVVRPAGKAWSVNAVPPEKGSFAQRKSLPDPWGGLRDAALAEVSGVADATFCHPALFVCGAASKDGALALARKAVEA
jgi:uncharacterized UPF0160 family protein